MSVQRLEPDSDGNLQLVDTVWEDSDGTSFAAIIEPLPTALPGMDAASASAANHATLDGLRADIAAALGGDVLTASQIVSGLETRIDRDLGVGP